MALPSPLVVPRARLLELDAGSRLEWIETDGRGGYASGTAVGTNTRRYHGLLVVARRPPTDRVVLLSRLEETVFTPDGARFDLGANFYPGTVHPRGHLLLEEFRLDPWPVWRYRLGALTLTRTLFVAREAGATVVEYRLEGGNARLELRPLIAGRDFHALVTANDVVSPRADAEAGRITYAPYPGIPPLVLSHSGGEWCDTGDWYHQMVYPREAELGLDDREDLFCPGVLSASLEADVTWRLACATRPVEVEEAELWREAERERREEAARRGRRAAARAPQFEELGARLALAADDFLVERDGAMSIIAGYPWFADWGRDAMISIPGLCLATGRLDEAAAVLRAYAAHIRDGLIPNRFPDYGGEVPPDHYNAADASLWFVEAVGALADAGGDVASLWPAVSAILDGYRHGTRYGIGIDDDGLVVQGEEGVQLTWMDAKVDGWVVTPRAGKAVEINALWYNALHRAARLAGALGADPTPYESLARRTGEVFEAFWYEDGGYLYDVIDPMGRPDPALRPNQLLAVSLPHSPLDGARARRVVDAVERSLLVPLGVRTLSPDDPAYQGDYAGDRYTRDEAYHQGTAWPWLLGPLAAAWRRVHGGGARARERIGAILRDVEAHMEEFGLGHVAEVVAGDPPHRPGGCFAQAWSCAEALRILQLL